MSDIGAAGPVWTVALSMSAQALDAMAHISMWTAGGKSVAVRGGSSGPWGRLLERLGWRPRSLVNLGFHSRYFRPEDGHPSPSPAGSG